MPPAAASPPAPKRIILCFDGTWQSSVSGQENSPSNITRLCRAIKPVANIDGQDWQQIVWYDSGVGTTSLAVSKLLEGAVGNGLDGNIVEAYNFVSLNWNRGDKILCFGFSRGAYTARAIAGLIADAGICRRRDLHRFPDLWKLYSNPKREGPFYNSDDYFQFVNGVASEKHRDHPTRGDGLAWDIPGHSNWAQPDSRQVEVVAVYDTVQALGMPEVAGIQLPSLPKMAQWKGHNVTLSRHIKHAFQALALDEYRKAFYPEVWCLPSGDPDASQPEVRAELESEAERKRKILNAAGTKQRGLIDKAKKYGQKNPTDYATLDQMAKQINVASKELGKARQDYVVTEDHLKKEVPKLTQVWFPGYHINVGGGSSDTLKNEGDLEEMSNIVFAWMLDRIKPFVGIDEPTIKDHYKHRQERIAALNTALAKENAPPGEQESWGEYLGRGAKWVASTVLHPFTPAPTVTQREYTWGLSDMPDSFIAVYYPNGKKKRAPNVNFEKEHRGVKEVVGPTCAQIHPVVNYRVQHKAGYRPIGLLPEQYHRRAEGENFVYTLNGKELPEWRLGGKGSYEWLALRQHQHAIEYMAEQGHADAIKYVAELKDKPAAKVDGA
ncbi:T6SS phospholipase effector Tle1-like catalytic domain-containing protein [Aspergillus saccharolyticus JOP 1030-1]|uniref:T6SS Phospholipase effector Tle1-like catalytic domain-containing protein n=1 Tax=Aspergillus saccharolyticus JOP 1030-1 TaxID=1450539 RepID=A0A318ZGM3_9EURO|nr:hypothetical protein BP01DRAFT_356100 [Aspergillus saccharolyticus JOP 1030-1]PYH45897.1 hypothetical protein BP01DRAFT_356100 [Aspergillus saccharolyticus JOP 1030-1]